ncbi:penicillin-binding transpeptidase domain-containing protein [Amycolatopsis sp. cg5]|uniref:penicillin-binding transpeptidase domain-containing protein n=1 Tax=Amycolatopsis sp. cg5 TaxID=3238802 RepID=UPI003523764C
MPVRPLLLVGLLLASLTACSSTPGPEDVLNDFLGAIASGDTTRAAMLTNSPDAAKAVLDQARGALTPQSLQTSVQEVHDPAGSTTADAKFRYDWNLGHGRQWRYDASAQLFSEQDNWKIRWLPTVLHPKLGAQQLLAVRVDTPPLAAVLDRDGVPILEPGTVVGVLMDPKLPDPGPVAGKLAAALAKYEPSVTQKSIVDGLKAQNSTAAYSVVSLRAGDYQRVKPVIYDLPGVKFSKQERLLPIQRDFGRQVLPAVRSMVEDQIAGHAGWRVMTVGSMGIDVAELYEKPAEPAPAIASTLSGKVQEAGEKAIDSVKTPAALVAIQPSTGELLAVAQNDKADEQGPLALTGRFPPGSTFKIVTAAAAMSAGKVGSDSIVDCPGTTAFDGRVVPNEGKFSLGAVPLTKAFARSCNTTFARLAADLPPAALTESARDLGLGADFALPGLTTVTGSVPATDNVVQRAENGFGQGTVVASPFGMALVAASVQSGRTPTPTLLRGIATGTQNLGKQLRPDVLDALRGMMRAVVTEGTATGLRDLPDVRGKTGTAQFGDGSHSHGWFVGYAGDLAFAVLLVDAGSSKPAVEAAHRFLAGLG